MYIHNFIHIGLEQTKYKPDRLAGVSGRDDIYFVVHSSRVPLHTFRPITCGANVRQSKLNVDSRFVQCRSNDIHLLAQ